MISIITPVFQCEDYLQALIESIICQTYTDWELLLIDDGSKDGSPEICDRYARENPRIRVVHRTNGGPAAARNEAVAMARGEYVAFADSDDWTEPRWLELLHATARERQADIVVCDFFEEYTNQTVRKGKCDDSVELMDRKEALLRTFKDEIKCYLWSMLVRKEVMQEPFSNYRAYEDYATVFKWMSHVETVVRLRTPLYHYRQSAASTLHCRAAQNNIDLLNATMERYRLISDKGLLREDAETVNGIYTRMLIKAAKDLSRSSYSKGFKIYFLREISSELKKIHLSSSYRHLGAKCLLRYKLIKKSPKLFKSIAEKSSVFCLKNKNICRNLYK